MKSSSMQPIDDNLLIKYLLDEIEPKGRISVEQWIAESPVHEQQYLQLKQIWETSKRLALQSVVDEDAAWDRFQQLLPNKRDTNTVQESPNQLTMWLKIAAIFFLAGIGSWVAYSVFMKTSTIHLRTANTVQTDTLSEGSVIVLNKNTEIEYPASFARHNRTVNLIKGEAFFDVAPNPSKPFIVHIGNVKVRVVGTSFNIKKQDESTQLIVESGIVEVTQNDVIIRLKKNEMVDIHPSTNRFDKKTVQDKLYTYYRNKEFVADDTPLYRLVAVLNEAYQANIIIQDPELEKLELNTTFKDTSLDSIINIICETFQIKAKRQEESIILYR